jgi:hypothetical protein
MRVLYLGNFIPLLLYLLLVPEQPEYGRAGPSLRIDVMIAMQHGAYWSLWRWALLEQGIELDTTTHRYNDPRQPIMCPWGAHQASLVSHIRLAGAPPSTRYC